MNLRSFFAKKNFVIPRHQWIRNTHQLSKHFGGRLIDSNIVAEALAHLLDTIETFENRLQAGHLLRLTFCFLKVAPNHDIEELVGSSHFNVGTYHHGIPALHDRILKFVQRNRVPLIDSGLEIIALEHLLDRNLAIEPDDLQERHFLEPFSVEHGLSSRAVKNLERLIEVGLC